MEIHINGIWLGLDQDNCFWIRKIYLTVLLNNINIWFFKPHNIWPREVDLDCIWTILLDIIHYTKKWENILYVLLTYVNMTCNIQSCIKSVVIWMEISSYKLPKDGAVKAAWINTILKCRKQLIQESLHTFVTTSLFGWLINS